jgi:hypothetical protein
MAFEHREGGGSLFSVDKKSDKAPNMRGEFMLNGEMYEIAAWTKEGKKGKFLSLQVKPARQIQTRPSPNPRPPQSIGPQMDDNEIPF